MSLGAQLCQCVAPLCICRYRPGKFTGAGASNFITANPMHAMHRPGPPSRSAGLDTVPENGYGTGRWWISSLAPMELS